MKRKNIYNKLTSNLLPHSYESAKLSVESRFPRLPVRYRQELNSNINIDSNNNKCETAEDQVEDPKKVVMAKSLSVGSIASQTPSYQVQYMQSIESELINVSFNFSITKLWSDLSDVLFRNREILLAPHPLKSRGVLRSHHQKQSFAKKRRRRLLLIKFSTCNQLNQNSSM
jgi:hypothetical protein